jgi:hypothetical protein
MDSEDVIRLIKKWLGDIQDGHLTAIAFVQVVESLITVYEEEKR